MLKNLTKKNNFTIVNLLIGRIGTNIADSLFLHGNSLVFQKSFSFTNVTLNNFHCGVNN